MPFQATWTFVFRCYFYSYNS